jgi:hypothetical protein
MYAMLTEVDEVAELNIDTVGCVVIGVTETISIARDETG